MLLICWITNGDDLYGATLALVIHFLTNEK